MGFSSLYQELLKDTASSSAVCSCLLSGTDGIAGPLLDRGGTLKEYLWIWQALFLLSGQDVQGRMPVCSEMESLRKIALFSSNSIHYPPVKMEQRTQVPSIASISFLSLIFLPYSWQDQSAALIISSFIWEVCDGQLPTVSWGTERVAAGGVAGGIQWELAK